MRRHAVCVPRLERMTTLLHFGIRQLQWEDASVRTYLPLGLEMLPDPATKVSILWLCHTLSDSVRLTKWASRRQLTKKGQKSLVVAATND